MKYEYCVNLLNRQGLPITDNAEGQLQQYLDLIIKWNDYASLVSPNDLPRLRETHVVDSLSLLPVIVQECGDRARLLDVGSGGGFPAIPAQIVLPSLDVTLIERSEKKVAFLRKAVAALGLSGIRIKHGEFPHCAEGERPDTITARAVEKPRKFVKNVVPFVEAGALFLCQSGDPRPYLREKFHVEHVRDSWTKSGLRRGDLYLVRLAVT